MIYKWSKTKVWYTFWLNINEMQPWRFIRKNRNPISLDSTSCFWFHWSYSVWNWFIKFISCIWFTLFPSLWSFNGISGGFVRSISWYQNALGNALVVCDWYGLFMHSGYFSVYKGQRVPSYFGFKNPLSTFSKCDFSALKLLNH